MAKMSMWILIALLFVAVKAFEDGVEKVDCEKRAYTACNPRVKRVMKFPGSEEDLNTICPIFIQRVECLNNHDEVCSTTEEGIRAFPKGQFAKIRELLSDICNNNSLLHKVLAENMRCIKESVEDADERCSPRRTLLRKTYMGDREVDYESESLEELLKFQCLLSYDSMACMTGDISRRCGDTPKAAALEVMFRSTFLQSDHCLPETNSEMVDLVNGLELPAQHKEDILDLISSYDVWASENK